MTTPQFDLEKIATHPLFAGAVGALLSLRAITGATFGTRASYVVTGLACAYFLAPPLAEYINVTKPSTSAAVAFALGLFAVGVVDWAREQAAKLTIEQVLGWLPWFKKGQ